MILQFIQEPDPDFLPRSRIPGSKRHRIPIRNTDVGIVIFGTFTNSNFKKGAHNQSIIAEP
jgi:hypothetical protein